MLKCHRLWYVMRCTICVCVENGIEMKLMANLFVPWAVVRLRCTGAFAECLTCFVLFWRSVALFNIVSQQFISVIFRHFNTLSRRARPHSHRHRELYQAIAVFILTHSAGYHGEKEENKWSGWSNASSRIICTTEHFTYEDRLLD